jgi:hypothetical protein
LETLADSNTFWRLAIAQQAREQAQAIKTALNYTVSDRTTDTQIVHELLLRLGIKTEFRWSVNYPGQEGEKVRVYRIAADLYYENLCILKRRQSKRLEREQQRSAPLLTNTDPGVILLLNYLEKVAVVRGHLQDQPTVTENLRRLDPKSSQGEREIA